MKVLRIVSAYDVGKAVSPKMVEQQIEGGLITGIGSTIYEGIALDVGAVLNPSFVDYHIPSTAALSNNEKSAVMIVEASVQEGLLGAK